MNLDILCLILLFYEKNSNKDFAKSIFDFLKRTHEVNKQIEEMLNYGFNPKDKAS